MEKHKLNLNLNLNLNPPFAIWRLKGCDSGLKGSNGPRKSPKVGPLRDGSHNGGGLAANGWSGWPDGNNRADRPRWPWPGQWYRMGPVIPSQTRAHPKYSPSIFLEKVAPLGPKILLSSPLHTLQDQSACPSNSGSKPRAVLYRQWYSKGQTMQWWGNNLFEKSQWCNDEVHADCMCSKKDKGTVAWAHKSGRTWERKEGCSPSLLICFSFPSSLVISLRKRSAPPWRKLVVFLFSTAGSLILASCLFLVEKSLVVFPFDAYQWLLQVVNKCIYSLQ